MPRRQRLCRGRLFWPRHYRESPVNAIWEGSGNVMCLDVLRALSREADAATAILQGLAQETKGLPGAAEAAASIGKAFRRGDAESIARLAVEKLALLAATAALNAISPRQAELFAATRLAEITAACTALWTWRPTTSAGYSTAHYLHKSYLHKRLFDGF